MACRRSDAAKKIKKLHNLPINLLKELQIYRNGKSAKFFWYAGNGKYFEELFTLVLNETVVSGWYVPSAHVTHSERELTYWLQRIESNKALRNEEIRQQWWLFPKRNRHKNPVAIFECARVNKSIIYVTNYNA